MPRRSSAEATVSLRRTGSSAARSRWSEGDGSAALEPTNLARLIDSPLQMGRYVKHVELSGATPDPQLTHVISIVADSEAALDGARTDFAADYGRLVAQAGALFGTRMYRHYTWLLTLSDHVAHFGLEHHESSDDRTDENSLSDGAAARGGGGAAGARVRAQLERQVPPPRGTARAPTTTKPMDGSLLWVYEGMTQFWGTVLPVRAGLVPPDSYREMLASRGRRPSSIESGNRWRALGRHRGGGADPLRRAGRLGGVAPQRRFLRGVRVPVAQRRHGAAHPHGGRVSLDDFVRRFYAGAGGQPALKPYVEADVYAALASVVPGDWRALIRGHLDSLGPQTLLAGLRERAAGS